MSIPKGVRLGCMALCCAPLAGCVKRTTIGEEVTFHYQLWLPLGIFIVGMACIPIGLAFRKKYGGKAWAFAIAGPLVAVAWVPQLYCERTRVDPNGFEVYSGILGQTANHEITFDDVKSIRVDQELLVGRVSREIAVLHFEFKKGPAERVPLNNDVKTEAANEILVRAIRRGIPVK
jgi:hypothetical protein